VQRQVPDVARRDLGTQLMDLGGELMDHLGIDLNAFGQLGLVRAEPSAGVL
jgi:hypothetical protein